MNVEQLMSENAALRKRVAELEDALFQEESEADAERALATRMVDRLIALGQWRPGLSEEFQQ